MLNKTTCRLIGCVAFLFAATHVDAQLMGLTEEECLQQNGGDAVKRANTGENHAPLPKAPEEEQKPAKDFPELHAPLYQHILQDRIQSVEEKKKNLQTRFLAALQKLRDKSVKENDFAAVARIHALIGHTQQGGDAPPPPDLPPKLKRAVDAYKLRMEKLLQDEKVRFLADLEAMQKSLVARNDFDQLARIQTSVEQMRAKPPEELFSSKSSTGEVVTYLPGTWIQKNNDGSANVVIIIRPDGTCNRYNSVSGTKEPAVLKKITDYQWANFIVCKIDENVFQFFSYNGPIGTFSFLDKDTFSMPYNGPGIHTRASQQDKPYRLEE